MWSESCDWKPFMWATYYGIFPNVPGQDRAPATAIGPGVYEVGISYSHNSNTM